MTPDELRASARDLRRLAAYADSRSGRLHDLDRAAEYERQAIAMEQPDTVTPAAIDDDDGEAEFQARLSATRASEALARSARIRKAMRQMEAYLGLPHKD
jgi:hypothetical protein